MGQIDAIIANRVLKPAGLSAGDVPVWNGSTFVVPGGTRNGTKFLRDDGTWQTPGGAVVQIASVVLGSSTASLDTGAGGFSTAYNHLKVIIACQGDAAAADASTTLRFNNDSGTVYGYNLVRFNNNTVTVTANGNQTGIYLGESPAATGATTAMSAIEFTVPNYASTTKSKSITGSSSATPSFTGAANFWSHQLNGMWIPAVQAAINRITVFPGSGNWVAGSVMHVYGML